MCDVPRHRQLSPVEEGGVQRALDDEALAAIEARREKLHHQVINNERRKGATAADGGAAPRQPVPPQHGIDVRLPVRGVPKAPPVLGPRAHHGPRSEHRVTSYTNTQAGRCSRAPRWGPTSAGRCKSTCPGVWTRQVHLQHRGRVLGQSRRDMGGSTSQRARLPRTALPLTMRASPAAPPSLH